MSRTRCIPSGARSLRHPRSVEIRMRGFEATIGVSQYRLGELQARSSLGSLQLEHQATANVPNAGGAVRTPTMTSTKRRSLRAVRGLAAICTTPALPATAHSGDEPWQLSPAPPNHATTLRQRLLASNYGTADATSLLDTVGMRLTKVSASQLARGGSRLLSATTT